MHLSTNAFIASGAAGQHLLRVYIQVATTSAKSRLRLAVEVPEMSAMCLETNYIEVKHCIISGRSDDSLEQKIAGLTARKQQHLVELGMMVVKASQPIPLSVIPNPLCNWKVSRISLIDAQIEALRVLDDITFRQTP